MIFPSPAGKTMEKTKPRSESRNFHPTLASHFCLSFELDPILSEGWRTRMSLRIYTNQRHGGTGL